MVDRFDIISLVAAGLFFYWAGREFYLHKHVDRLEEHGKIKPEVAARIRSKGMPTAGWLGIAAGVGFLLKVIFDF